MRPESKDPARLNLADSTIDTLANFGASTVQARTLPTDI